MKLRFSPSPAGLIHIGSARIALANWLTARRDGGRFILRIDDTDPIRHRPEFAEAAEHDLAWLGLDWDTLLRQSERQDRYQQAAEQLKAANRLYPCFESDEELAAKRDQRARRNQAPIYDRAMLKLTPDQRAKAEAGGKRPYWRFLLSQPAAEWPDMIAGRTQVKLSALSDPILIRADGSFLPAFTAAVDDRDLAITHIIRSADNATITAIELDIRTALGAKPGAIRYAHLPPLAENHPPARQTPPYNPPQPPHRRHRARRPRRHPRSPRHPRRPRRRTPGPPRPPLRPRPHRQSLPPPSTPANSSNSTATPSNPSPSKPSATASPPPPPPPSGSPSAAISTSCEKPAAGGTSPPAASSPPSSRTKPTTFTPLSKPSPPEPWDATTWSAWTAIVRKSTGRKGKSLFLPLRQALTGEDQGPDLDGLLPLMGRARVAERLTLAAA